MRTRLKQSFVIIGYPKLLCGFCGKSSATTGEERHITWIYNQRSTFKTVNVSLVAQTGFHYSKISTNGVKSDDDSGVELKYQLRLTVMLLLLLYACTMG